ncbi:MAG TPA: hypothetical protein PKO22_07320, partial [Treponemataceae bacterium]|nr:hypothetical protein [Treponemataceae bacterium]
IQVMEGITMAESGKAPTVTKEIEELRLQLAYYKKLSEILEAESKDVKKKRVAERFNHSQQKDIQ